MSISEKQLQVQLGQKKEQLEILKNQIRTGGLYKEIALSNKESKIRARAEGEINHKLKEQAFLSGEALLEAKQKTSLKNKEERLQDQILTRLERQGFMTDRLISKNKELAAVRKESLKSLQEEGEKLRYLDDRSFGQENRGKRDSERAKAKYEKSLQRDIDRGGFSLDSNGNLQGKIDFKKFSV